MVIYTTYKGQTARAIVWKRLYPYLLESYKDRARTERWFESSEPLLIVSRSREGFPESYLLLSVDPDSLQRVRLLYTFPDARNRGLGTELLAYAAATYSFVFYPGDSALERMARRAQLVWEWKIQGYRSLV